MQLSAAAEKNLAQIFSGQMAVRIALLFFKVGMTYIVMKRCGTQEKIFTVSSGIGFASSLPECQAGA